MSYEKQTWNKYDDLKTEEENIVNGAVVTDNRMNHIEEGIESNDKANSSQAQSMNKHIADTANPHKVTALQVGLDKVDNVQQATKTDFDSHVNNKSNPHAVTASQVGAYSKSETDTKFASIQSLTDLSNKVIANKGNLASGTDLDNVIDIGTYRIGGLTGGTDIINVPSERSGTTIYAYLTVSGTTTSVVQELIVYDSKTVSQIYSRSRSGSTPTFSPWSKTVMADDSGKVTITGLEIVGDIPWTDISPINGFSLTPSTGSKGVLKYKIQQGVLYVSARGVVIPAVNAASPTSFVELPFVVPQNAIAGFIGPNLSTSLYAKEVCTIQSTGTDKSILYAKNSSTTAGDRFSGMFIVPMD